MRRRAAHDGNLSRYSLMRYGIKGRPAQYMDAEHGVAANVVAVAGGRLDLPSFHSAHASVSNSMEMRLLIHALHPPRAEVAHRVTAHVFVNAGHAAGGSIASLIYVSKTMNAGHGIVAGISAKHHVGKRIWASHESGGQMPGSTHMGKRMNAAHPREAFVSAIIAMGLTKYGSFTLDVTIPPGGEVRVDSDVFTAMMGQANILHTFKGDWIFFERNTAQLVIDSATRGEIAGEVIFNTRYI